MNYMERARRVLEEKGLSSLYSLNSHSPKDVQSTQAGPKPPLGSVSERVGRGELSEQCELSAERGQPVLDVDGDPTAPCACGCGEFYRAPGGHWRCAGCEPQTLPADAAGWAFCTVPGGTSLPREPLPFPPGWGCPSVVFLDQILPDPSTAPIGKCAGCRFTSPLTTEQLCGPCVLRRMQP